MLEYNVLRRFEEVSQNCTLVVVGAGVTCKNFLNTTNNNDNPRLVICDNSKSVQEMGIFLNGSHHRVFPVDVITNLSQENMVIVIATKYYSDVYMQIQSLLNGDVPIFVFPFIESREIQYKKQIRQCLSDYYYHNHFDLKYRGDYVNKEYEKLDSIGGLVIPYLPVYLTTRCTLNCDKCNNLIPDLKEKSHATDFSIRKTRESLDYLIKCVQEITFCELVGGEPFLYKNLDEMLQFVGNEKKIRQIVIVTNGTVIPSEETLKLLKKYNVLVRISDYGMFDKMSHLIVLLEKYDINVRVLQDMKWNDPGNTIMRGKSKEELFFQYNKCIFSLRCKYLCEDHLYTCARIASLALLNIYDGEEDSLRIGSEITEKEIYSFYMNETGRGCDYCDLCSVTGGKEIQAAIQRGGSQISHSQYTVIRNDYLNRLKKGK